MWRREPVANGIKTNVDNLQPEIMKLLKDYGDKASKAINLAVEDEAKDIRKKVRQKAKSAGIKGRKYKNGWQIRTTVGANGVNCQVYNGPKYRLVHLLEKGHRIVSKAGKDVGEAKPYPHVEPAAENMDRELMDKIQKNLETLS